jgi:paraquat-inducible protein A
MPPHPEPQHVECCPFCAEPYVTGETPPGQEWYCTWCEQTLSDPAEVEGNVSISRRFALAGLLLLVPAFALPMLAIEQFGVRTESGLVEGVITLLRSGEFLLAAVIGLLSGLFPCLKLAGLVMLTSRSFIRVKHHRWIYRIVEFSGRWGMIDVFLTAVMVFALKFSSFLNITARPGIVAFTAMVLCNLLATAYFDTRIYRRHFHVIGK